MRNFIRQNFNFEILVLIIISLIPLLWFQKDHVILGLDSGYAVDHVKFFEYRMNTWMPNPNFGVDMSAEMGLLPLVALPAAISAIGVSIFEVQKILLVGWFFLLAISTFLFFKEVFSKKDQWIIRLTATFIYIFNFHLYSFWLQGEQPMLASYVILPLFMLLLFRFVRKKAGVVQTALLLNVVYIFFGSGGIRGIPLVAPVILSSLLTFAYFGLLNFKKEKFSYFLRFLALLIVSVVILVPLNAYWIFPFISSFSHEFDTQVTIAGGIEGAISWTRFISEHDSFLNLFRLHGDNNWYRSLFLWSNNYLVNPFLIVASFVFPLAAFAAPLFAKAKDDKKIICFFAALAIISIFFAAGAHAPFGEIYVLMMRYIPGFATFRSAYYKFMPTVYFAFAPLIGFTIYSLSQKLNKKSKIILGIGFLIFILAYSYPYFQNTNAAFNKPFTTLVKVPDYVYDFGQMINSSNISEKTLVVPQTNKNVTIKAYTWGYYGSFSIFALMTDKPFVQYDAYLFNESANALIDTMYSKLREGNYDAFKNAAAASGIKYILFAEDTVSGYSVFPLEKPEAYKKVLLNKDHFEKVWEKGAWSLYRIEGEVEKTIDVHSEISVVRPDARALSSYFDESNNPFVLSDQINESTLSKLAKGEELVEHACLSCIMEEKRDLPTVPYANFTPDSAFYKLKLDKDKKTLDASSKLQKADIALGLSMKRVAELNRLVTGSFNKHTRDDWITAINLTKSYWQIIDDSLKKDLTYPDYGRFQNIYNYANVQKKTLKKIGEETLWGNDPEFSSQAAETISIINNIESSLGAILTEKDWSKNFVYKIDKDKNIADIKISNTPGNSFLTPARIDNSTLPEVISSSGYYHTESEPIISLELEGGITPLINGSPEMIDVANSTKSCQTYPIEDFRWDKKYILTVTSVSINIPKTIYVKMNRDHFKTQDTIEPNPNVFTPHFTLSPENPTDIVSTFEFNGVQNDTGATIYLCTDSHINPSLGFKDVSLRTRTIPRVYSFDRSEGEKNVVPAVTYKKLSSSKYQISIKNASKPYILSLLETNSPNWKLYIKGKEQDEKFMVNGFANGWYIDEKGTYEASLEFYPEKAFRLGIIVTLVFLALVTTYLIRPIFKKQ